VQALRKFAKLEPVRNLILIHGGEGKAKKKDYTLPLTIKFFTWCMGAGFMYALFESANDLDPSTKAIIGILASLVGVLAMLVYRDLVRRIQASEDSTRDLGRKVDKSVRVFTGLLMATLPNKAAEIAAISEAFFKED
jgi:hypothetical protein